MRKTRLIISKRDRITKSFLHCGFTFLSENNKHHPLCLIYNKVLTTESLKPPKLKKHLHTKHDSHRNRLVTVNIGKNSRQSFESEFVNEGKYTRASFEDSLLITKSKKPYNIGEELNLPAAIKMNAIVHGEKEANEMQKVDCQTDTV